MSIVRDLQRSLDSTPQIRYKTRTVLMIVSVPMAMVNTPMISFRYLGWSLLTMNAANGVERATPTDMAAIRPQSTAMPASR